MVQRGNPFYIDPMGGYGESIVQGLTGLGAVLGERQRLKQEQMQEQEDLQEMQNLVRSGQPGQVADFILRKPKLAERLTTSVTYLNDQTEQNAYDTLKKIEMGADPVAALSERLMFLEQNSADPTDTIKELQSAMDNPEQYMQTAGKKREMLFPTRYLQELKLENEKRRLQQGAIGESRFQQGTGPMAGYVFDPVTGAYARSLPDSEMPAKEGQKPPQGYRFNAQGDLEAIPGGPADLKSTEQGKKDSQQVLGAANAVIEAASIIPKSTGSFLGNIADKAAAFFGESTEGAENIAKLDVIGAKLVGNVPRFEGPQSNIDVQMYKQAAADVANPLKPPPVRLAALKTAAELIAKDAELKGIALPADFRNFVFGEKPKMPPLPPVLQGFSESAIADAAKQEGVSIEEFIQIMSQ